MSDKLIERLITGQVYRMLTIVTVHLDTDKPLQATTEPQDSGKAA